MTNSFADFECEMNFLSALNQVSSMSPKPFSLDDPQDSSVSVHEASMPELRPPSFSMPPSFPSSQKRRFQNDGDADKTHTIQPQTLLSVKKRVTKQLEKKSVPPEFQYLSVEDQSKLRILQDTIEQKTEKMREKVEENSKKARGSKSSLCNTISSLRKRLNEKIAEKQQLLQKAENLMLKDENKRLRIMLQEHGLA